MSTVSFLVLFSIQLTAQSFFTTDTPIESPFLFGNTALSKTKQSDVINFPGSSGNVDWSDFGYSYFEQPLNRNKMVSHSGFALANLHPAGNHLVGFSISELKNDSSVTGEKIQIIYSFSFPLKFYRQRIGISFRNNLLDNFTDGSSKYKGIDLGLDAGYFESDILPECSLKKDQYLEGGIRFGITIKNLVQYSELRKKTDNGLTVLKTSPDLVLGIGYLLVNTEKYLSGFGYSFSIQANNKTKFEVLSSTESKRKSHQFSGSFRLNKWSLDISARKWADSVDNQNAIFFGYSASRFRLYAGRSYFSNESALFVACQLSFEQKMQ